MEGTQRCGVIALLLWGVGALGAVSAEEKRAGLDWWSFQAVERPDVPAVNGARPLGAIDAFVRARLEWEGLKPAGEADRRTLIRRLHFDLTGLSPTAAEIEKFEANDAQEVVVWCADQQDPDRFILFEIYRDAEALGANAGADWFAAYMQAAMPLLAGEPEVTMATPMWSTGV